ncbi:MAG: nucleoside-diphosphate kinase [archaeon]
MKEQTLVLLKPETIERGICGEIITRFERLGLKIVAMKMIKPTLETAKNHYPYTKEWALSNGMKIVKSLEALGLPVNQSPEELSKKVNEKLINYFVKHPTPLIAMVIEGHGAIAIVRKLAGSTNPCKAEPGTIRGDFSHDSYDLADKMNRPATSVIHASDSRENAYNEIRVWFRTEEIYSYSNLHDKLTYFWTKLE